MAVAVHKLTQAVKISQELQALEDKSEWKMRILTRIGMAANRLSINTICPLGSTTGNRTVDAADQVSTQVRNQWPVAIFWDIENCQVPAGVHAEDVANNIRLALQQHPETNGAVTTFKAYGDINNFPRKLREGCQRTGVNLIDVPSGKKDAADKAILVGMLVFALDNPPPCTIFLISGDVDFAPALHELKGRGYTVVLAVQSRFCRALYYAGQFVWDWPSIARRGECNRPVIPNDEEANVYNVGTQSAGPLAQPSAATLRSFSSSTKPPSPSAKRSSSAPPPSRPSCFTDASSSSTSYDTSRASNSTQRVRPQDLNWNLTKNVNTAGGKKPLQPARSEAPVGQQQGWIAKPVVQEAKAPQEDSEREMKVSGT